MEQLLHIGAQVHPLCRVRHSSALKSHLMPCYGEVKTALPASSRGKSSAPEPTPEPTPKPEAKAASPKSKAAPKHAAKKLGSGWLSRFLTNYLQSIRGA